MFCNKTGTNEALTPTDVGHSLNIERASYQCLILRNALVPQPDMPSPQGNGWGIFEGTIHPLINDTIASSLFTSRNCQL